MVWLARRLGAEGDGAAMAIGGVVVVGCLFGSLLLATRLPFKSYDI
jgi:hypothetical protein